MNSSLSVYHSRVYVLRVVSWMSYDELDTAVALLSSTNLPEAASFTYLIM